MPDIQINRDVEMAPSSIYIARYLSKFGGMIGYYPGTIWLDFGIDRVNRLSVYDCPLGSGTQRRDDVDVKPTLRSTCSFCWIYFFSSQL